MYYCSNSGNSVTLTASITPRLLKIKGKKITKFNKIFFGEVVVFVLKKPPLECWLDTPLHLIYVRE